MWYFFTGEQKDEKLTVDYWDEDNTCLNILMEYITHQSNCRKYGGRKNGNRKTGNRKTGYREKYL